MLNIATDQDRMTIRLPARLDTTTCLQWQDDLLARVEQHKGPVVFDLADVTFLASAFLRVCMQVFKIVGAANFKIIGLSPPIRKVFKVAGLDQHMSLE